MCCRRLWFTEEKGWLWDQTLQMASFPLPPPLSWSKPCLTPHILPQQQNHTEQKPTIHTEASQEKTGAVQVTVSLLGQMSHGPEWKRGRGSEGARPEDTVFASCAFGFIKDLWNPGLTPLSGRWRKWGKSLISNTYCDGFKIRPWILFSPFERWNLIPLPLIVGCI